MSITKKLSGLSRRKVIAGWIAVVATILLSAEILWTVDAWWPTLEPWQQAATIVGTFLIVVIFGWRKSPAQQSGGIV